MKLACAGVLGLCMWRLKCLSCLTSMKSVPLKWIMAGALVSLVMRLFLCVLDLLICVLIFGVSVSCMWFLVSASALSWLGLIVSMILPLVVCFIARVFLVS